MLVAAFNGVTMPFTGLLLRREFDASPFQLSLGATAGAVAMLLALAWTRVTIRHSPLLWLVGAGIAGRGLLLLTPWVESAWSFAGLVALSTFVVSLPGPAYAAVIARVYPRVVRGRALAVVRGAAGVAGIAVAIGAGALLESVGFRAAFVMAALAGVAGSVVLLAVPLPVRHRDATDDPRADGRPGPRGFLENRAFVWLMASSFLFGLGCWIQIPARPITLADVVRVTPLELGWLQAAGGVAFVAASLVCGRLIDRRGSLAALWAVYVMGLLATVFFLTARTPLGLLGGFLADSVLGLGLELVWVVALIDVVGPGRAARAAAVSATLTGVRGLVGPLLGVALVEGVGVSGVYVVALTMMAVSLVMLARVTGATSAWARPAAGPSPSLVG